MNDYISNYTGEEIDAGIAKANTALQSYEYLNSVIEQAFDEITDEDTEITLNNTIQAKMKMELKGNTEQNGTPTPDNPQDVRVVTGNNTIIVSNSDNTQSQTHPINLGTMELCKIGTSQDYIYKDNGKWYKHSEIGKVVLDGSEENLSYNSTANRLQMPFNLQTQDWGALALTLCDHFTMGDTEIVDGSFNITRTALFFKNNNLTSLNDWKTWLGSNNTTVYYVLATSTNTEITDTTLISQLNAIENAMSYKTQTNISQTNANLSFILYASALGKNQ